MDEAMSLLLTLELRSIGYSALNTVSQAIDGVTNSANILTVVASAATLSLAGLAAGAAGFVVMAEQAGKFNETMVETANNANMTDAQLQQMSAATLDLARNTGLSTTDIASGYMHVADEGFQGADAMNVLTSASESAASTGANVNQVANVLATTLHIWHLNGDQAAATMDTLHVASALSNVTLSQFAAGMQRLEPIAAAGGLSIDETAAALATLTRNGFNATMAATQVKNLIQHIIAPTQSAEAAIKALSQATGVDLVGDFTQTGLAVKGFTGVLADIATATHGNIQAFADLTGQQRLSTDQMNLVSSALGGNLQAMQDMVPATRGLYAEFILTGSGAADYVNVLQQIAKSHEDGGVTAQNFTRWEQTLGAQMEILKANVHVAAIELGENFTPIMTSIVTFLINDAIPALQMLGTFLGDKLIGAIQAVTKTWQNLVAAFNSGGLLGVIEQIISALINFATNMYNAGANLVEQLAQGMWDTAVSVVQAVINGIAQMIASFFVGNSPPPAGPLNKIQTGGKNTMTAWVDGAQQGLGGLQQVANSASYTLSSIGDKANFTRLTNDATQAKLAVIGLKDAGADASVALQNARDQVHNMSDDIGTLNAKIKEIKANAEAEIAPLQENADDLKYAIQQVNDTYAALDAPLQQQLDDLKQAVDYNQKIVDAQDEVALAQLNANIVADQGDVIQKSALETHLKQVEAQARELELNSQILDLKNKKKAAAGDSDKEQSLDLQLQALEIQKQIADLANRPQLASDTAAKDALQAKIAKEKADQAVAAAKQKEAEAKLEKEIADNKAKADALNLANKQTLLTLQEKITLLKDQEARDLVHPEAELASMQAIKQTLGDQVQALTDAKTAIGAATTKAAGLASQLGLAANAAKGIGGGFGGGGPKPPNLGDSFDPNAIATAIADRTKAAVETATADAVSKAQTAAKAAISKWATGVGAEIQAKEAQFGASVTAFADGGYKAFASEIQAKIQSLGPLIKTYLPVVSAAFGDLFDKLGSTVGPKIDVVLSSIGTAISTAIGPANMKILHDAADGFKDIGDRANAVKQVLEPLATSSSKLAGSIASGVGPALQSFVGFLGGAFDNAVKLIGYFEQHQVALDALKSVLLAIIGVALSAFIWLAVGALVAAVAATWAWVAALAAATVAFVIANAPIVAIGLAIAGLIFIVMELIRFWPQISAKAIEVWDAVKDKVEQVVGFVHDRLNDFMNWIGPSWDQLWDDVKKYFTDFWETIKAVAQLYIDIVKGAIKLFLDLVKGNFGDFKTDAKQIFKTLWDDVKQIFTDQLKSIGDAVKTGVDAALAILSSFAPQWADAGKNLVEAMAGGIKHAAQAVADAAATMVGNAVNAAKAKLGIQSPSTVFIGIGQNTGEGYARGLEASVSRVSGATAAMLAIPGSLSAGAVAGAGGGSGGGVTVIIRDNYILDDFAISQLADKVGQVITRGTGNSQFLARV